MKILDLWVIKSDLGWQSKQKPAADDNGVRKELFYNERSPTDS